MEFVAFIAFAALVVAWLFAPNGEVTDVPETATAPLQVGDAVA